MNTRTAPLHHWLKTPLGQRLLDAEVELLQQILPHLFGYHLLQIGSVGQGRLLDSSRIMHRCVLSRHADLISHPYSSVYAIADALPIAHDSIDVVLLPHTLEFEDHPHEILREVERVLIPEGHIVILGFNPISLWGISRWFLTRRQTAPWCGRFLTILRLKDWLALLGFEVIELQFFFFAFPFHNDNLKNYTSSLEKIAARWAKNLGVVYLLVAKKRVATLTPIKPKWQLQQALVPDAVGTHFEDNR
jgi:SAM-dependent methyltransferase